MECFLLETEASWRKKICLELSLITKWWGQAFCLLPRAFRTTKDSTRFTDGETP
jgi:hypothetical protein